jgi:hypothetical protein
LAADVVVVVVVVEPFPLGVDDPVPVPALELSGCVIFCLDRRRVLSDFNSD